ncbi:MAG: nuclear transport factor 2 family protein [Pseudomonadota bacterium]
MKKIQLSVLLILFASTPSIAGDADDILTLLHDFLARAHVKAAHERFWAEDLVYTGSAGTRTDKASILASFDEATDDQEPTTTYSGEDVRLKHLGDAAVVTFKLVGTPGDDSPVLYYYNTGTFVKRDGEWRVIAWQATKIPTEE